MSLDLNLIWFLLVAVLLAGYAILDGFDLGVGILHLFSRSELERRINLNAIGPVWDGNEVWLLTGGGALFAAFPIVYATVFSGFYLALMLLLLALIFRAVSLEFRNHVDSPTWRRVWDYAFGIGSLLAAILFGVAVGNILRGIPINQAGIFTGDFFGLLNPYAILIGLVSLAMFIMHGALYMTVKTDGTIRARFQRWAAGGWVAFIGLYVIATIATMFAASFLFSNVLGNFLFWIFFLLLLAGIVYIPVALNAGRYLHSFLASAVSIASIIGLCSVSMFPKLVPSITNLDYSLTVYNASSSQTTLGVMLIIALIGVPLVLVYTGYVYWVFKGKVIVTEQDY